MRRDLRSRIIHLKGRIVRDRRVAVAVAAGRGELPMRRVGVHRPPLVVADDVDVPRRVWATWIDDRFGRRHAAGIRAFRARNPEYEFRLVDDAGADAFVQRHFGDHPIADVYRRARFGPMRSDIWRYLVLLKEGGWYFDVKSALLRPLREFHGSGDGFVFAWERRDSSEDGHLDVPFEGGLTDRAVMNWALAAAPGHPLLRRLIDDICVAADEVGTAPVPNPKATILNVTGPNRLAATLRDHVADHGAAGLRCWGVEFGDTGCYDLPGSWTRFLRVPSYARAQDTALLHPRVDVTAAEREDD